MNDVKVNESIWQGGKYKITTDNLNCTLRKRTGRFVKDKITKQDTDELEYTNIAYCTTMENTLRFMLNDMLKDGFVGEKISDIQKIIGIIKECTKEVVVEAKRLEPVIIEVEKVVQKAGKGLGEEIE